MGSKEWLKQGASKGLTGLGTIIGLGAVSPWVMLILLVIVGVLALIFWTTLTVYGLTTAFLGFAGGLIFLWFISNFTDLSKHGGLLLTPIILGVLGYVAEHYLNFKAPLTITLPINTIAFNFDATVTLDTFLLIIIAFCFVIQLLINQLKK